MVKTVLGSAFTRQKGAQALVELAFVLPIVMVMLLGMIDLGNAYALGVAAQNGAREGARLAANAALDTTITDATIVQRVVDASVPLTLTCGTPATSGGSSVATCLGNNSQAWTVTVNPASKSSGSQVTVTLSGSVTPFTSFITTYAGMGSISITGSAAMVLL